MIRTSVAISAASSRPDCSTKPRTDLTSVSRIAAASSSEKPSSATSRKAWRGSGVIWPSLCSTGICGSVDGSDLEFTSTEFQIFVNRWYSATRGELAWETTLGSAMRASRAVVT